MKLTREEQETTITYCAADDTVSISTANPNDITYYDRLCKSRPDFIRKTHVRDPYVFYEAKRKSYTTVRLKAPAKATEAQRERARQMTALRTAKSAKS